MRATRSATRLHQIVTYPEFLLLERQLSATYFLETCRSTFGQPFGLLLNLNNRCTVSTRTSLLRLLSTAVLALLLALPAPARAQIDVDDAHIGVGVMLSDIRTIFTGGVETGSIPIPSFLVSVDVGETLRIEPVVGFTRVRSEANFPGGDSQESTVTAFRLGVGVFARSLRDETGLYYGARVGYNRASMDEGGEGESESVGGFFVGPTVGGSYFFSEYLSIGGDVELRYARFNREEDIGIAGETAEYTTSTISMRPSLVVRFFF